MVFVTLHKMGHDLFQPIGSIGVMANRSSLSSDFGKIMASLGVSIGLSLMH